MVEYIEKVVGTLAATSTYSELEILFPQTRGPFGGTGRSAKVPMIVIHDIDVSTKLGADFDAPMEGIYWHVSESSQTAIQELDDQGCIESGGVEISGTEAAGAALRNVTERIHKYPPIMYPYDTIFVGADCDDNVTATLKFRIGYTVRMVNRNELMRAMVPRR